MTSGRTSLGFILAGIAASLAAGCFSRPESKSPVPQPVAAAGSFTYQEDIEPIISKYCVECHGIEAEESGLDLRTIESILAGGDSGRAVIPGDPGESLLFEMVNDELMPPDGAMPAVAEIDLIRDWIAAGARP